jgi:hypothetical protein
MAKKARDTKNMTTADVQSAFSSDAKFRSYKNDGKGFDDFEEGEQIEGILLSIRDHEIRDTRTKQLKDIRVYAIKAGETTLKIGGRTILDRMCDEIMDENGGFQVDNKRYTGAGYDWLKGRAVRFIRGEDGQTREGNPLGTYEIQVEED